jgi:hypothetical protein
MQVASFLLLVTFIGIARTQSSNCSTFTTCSECINSNKFFSSSCCWESGNCNLFCGPVIIPCYDEQKLSTQFYITSGIAFIVVFLLSFTICIYNRKSRTLKANKKIHILARQQISACFIFFLFICVLLWLAVVVYLETFKKDNEFIQQMGSCTRLVGISDLYSFVLIMVFIYTLKYIGIDAAIKVNYNIDTSNIDTSNIEEELLHRNEVVKVPVWQPLPSYFGNFLSVLIFFYLVFFFWGMIIILGTWSHIINTCPF